MQFLTDADLTLKHILEIVVSVGNSAKDGRDRTAL